MLMFDFDMLEHMLEDYRCNECGRPSEMCRCGEDEEQEWLHGAKRTKEATCWIRRPAE